MYNKRGILGTIFLAIILAFLIIGLFLYFQIRTKGIEFTTGNFVFNINYKNQEEQPASDLNQNATIVEVPENKSEDNSTKDSLEALNNFSIENKELIIETNKS